MVRDKNLEDSDYIPELAALNYPPDEGIQRENTYAWRRGEEVQSGRQTQGAPSLRLSPGPRPPVAAAALLHCLTLILEFQ